MARGYNKVILMGNVAKDPDVRTTTSLLRVARFTLAVNREWKDKNTGEKKSEADFISCQAWGNTADVVEKYVHKGKPLMVEGRLRVTKYKDKAGVDKWATDVVVDNLMLLSSGKSEGEAAPSYSAPAQAQTAARPQATGKQPDENYDFPLDMSGLEVDVPF